MRRLNFLTALVAAVIIPLGGLLAAAPAMAYNVSAVYKDCEDNGQLTGHYSRAQLQAALNGLPSEVSEYSDCQELIQQALLHASSPSGGGHHGGANGAGGGGSDRGGGGSGKASTGGTGKGTGAGTKNGKPAGGDNAVTLAGSGIRPGSTGAGGGSSSLPVALVVVLILLALTAVSGGVVAIRRRVDAGHGT